VPFIKSWNPSAKASGRRPVEVDISKLEPGQLIRVEWRGKPVWVVKRTKQTLDALAAHDDKLRDPLPMSHSNRTMPTMATDPSSRKFVAVGICTHLGCSLLSAGQLRRAGSGVTSGFFCPCHGSKFDMAGRVFQGVPAPLNLVIPPYQFLSDTTILVGADGKEA
jgi:ubiquinol-cytochrome c reductase iron-sulfur subunit